MRTTDRRFIKTEKTIYEAVVNLLQKEDPESLTIEDLVHEADINKSTFYLHYQSLDQLVSALEDNLISGLSSELYLLDQSHTVEDFFRVIIKWCFVNKNLCSAVLKSSTYRFNGKIENLFKKYLVPLKPNKRNRITDEKTFLAISLIQSIVGVLRVWILDNCHFSKEIILSNCAQIIESDVFKNIINK